MRPRAVVATALARAFLAGDWEPEAMARRGQRCLDDRRRWLLHLARATRSAYPDTPRDAPAPWPRSLIEPARAEGVGDSNAGDTTHGIGVLPLVHEVHVSP